MPRIYTPPDAGTTWRAGTQFDLPAGPARHVQVLRMQPGQTVTLFDGTGGEWLASVVSMGRSQVAMQLVSHDPIEREASRAVHIALGVPANERMDWLVEKATELGAASIQPLTTERSVLRLSGDRADKKQAHWQAVAIAACEQCGRNRVPTIHPVQTLGVWLQAQAAGSGTPPLMRLQLSPEASRGPAEAAATLLPEQVLTLLSGPEGGLTPAEVGTATQHGFGALGLGARVLRAETAPLAALVAFTLAS